MKIGLCSLLMVACLSLSFSSSAANRFWVAAGASNWNNTANWSNVSGGAGGFSVPLAVDLVTFNNFGLGNCSIDIPVNITNLTVTAGYTGTLSQNANIISITNAGSFSGGVFAGGSANITVAGVFTLSGTAFTSTSAILELDNTVAFTSGSFAHNNGTVRLNGAANQNITGTSPAFYILEFVGNGHTYNILSAGNLAVSNSLNFTGASLYNLNTGTLDVNGDLNVTNTALGCGGNALVNINGAGTQNLNGSGAAGQGALPQLTINKPSGVLNLANYPSVSNNFTYTAGAISAGTSTFCFTRGNAAAYTISGSLTINNIAFITSLNTTFTIPVATTLTASGDLLMEGTANLTLNTGNINVNGNILLTNTGIGGGGTATINVVGAANETIDGTAILVNQNRLPVININKASGTLSLSGNISFSANVTYTAGTINPTTSTCYIVNTLTLTGSFSLYNLTIASTNNVTVTVAAGSTVTATNNFDMETAAFNITLNTGTIAVQGNIIDNNTGLAGGGSATILLNGSGAQNITSTGVIDQGRFPAITINKASGTLTFPSLITVRGNWTYTAGALDVSTNNSTIVFENNLTITGSHTLNNITFDGSGNFTFITAAGTTLTVNGNLGIMGANNVILNTGNINLFGDLILTNTAVGGGGTTVIDLVASVNQSITSALLINQSNLPAVTINKTGGILSFPPLITVRGNWTYSAGVTDLATNNSTVVFANTLSVTGTHTLNNVTLEGNNNYNITVNTGTILTVTGTLSTIGTNNINLNAPVAGATVIQAQGDILISNTGAGGGTGGILINGSGVQALTSTSAAGQGRLPYITIQKTTGTLSLNGIISESRDWTYSSGLVDATSSASMVVFGGNNLNILSAGMNFYNMTVSSNTSTLGNGLSVNKDLTINGTGILSAGGNTINLSGNWIDRGTAGFTEAASTVNFMGSSVQSITSPGGENFNNLIVNNSVGGIQLINNTSIATTFTMTSGNIDLNANSLTLGLSVANNGSLVYTAGTIINGGSFTRWFKAATIATGSVTGLFPVGTATDYRPLYVSAPVTAPTTGGTITVGYVDAVSNTAVSFPDGVSTVVVRKDLNWNVATGNLLAGGVYELMAAGTGFGSIGSVSDLRLTLVNSVVGNAGINAGTTTNPQINRTGLTFANLSNTFYVGSINSTNTSLPIALISFTASVRDKEVELNWSTSAEMNNDYFNVQRSKDAVGWETVQHVAGAGNSKNVTDYTALDLNPYKGKSYYRIMQTDLDGNQTFTPVRFVVFGTPLSSIAIYPNPATDNVRISFPSVGQYEVTLLNSNGQILNNPVFSIGDNLTLSVANFNAGLYFIQINHDGMLEIRKIVIKK